MALDFLAGCAGGKEMTGMPGAQPAWYAGTGVFLTLPCAPGTRSGDPGNTAACPEGQNGRMPVRSLLIRPFPELSARGW